MKKLLVTEAFLQENQDRLRDLAESIQTMTLGPNLDPMTIDLAFFSPDCYPDGAAEFMTAVLKAPRLDWLQTFSAGVDHPVFGTLSERGCRVTTASGASAIPISHAVVMHLLALGRRLPETLHNQREHRWQRLEGRGLDGTTTVVLGVGPIGLAVAELLPAFGSRVVALRRSVKGDEPCETWPITRLPEALSLADQVVLALPLTPDTNQILDAEAMALMPDDCLLVNVGRGELIDEAALVECCEQGRLGGVALDVFATEPLAKENPLWDLPNVIVTPHIAARVPATDRNAVNIFFDNLARYVAGEDLVNQIQ